MNSRWLHLHHAFKELLSVRPGGRQRPDLILHTGRIGPLGGTAVSFTCGSSSSNNFSHDMVMSVESAPVKSMFPVLVDPHLSQNVELPVWNLPLLNETQRNCFHLSQAKCHKMIRWHTQDLTERKQTDNQRTTLAPSDPVLRLIIASQDSDLRRKVVLISINTSWC